MKMKKEKMIKLNLQLFNDNVGDNPTPPQDGDNKDSKPMEIDYDKIINGVFSKLQESKKSEEKTVNQTTITGNVTTATDEYIKKSVEWEMKYNTLNGEHSKLKTQLEEANNKLAEANNKLKDYETFGKTADDIKENSRIVNDYKKQQGGLIKL